MSRILISRKPCVLWHLSQSLRVTLYPSTYRYLSVGSVQLHSARITPGRQASSHRLAQDDIPPSLLSNSRGHTNKRKLAKEHPQNSSVEVEPVPQGTRESRENEARIRRAAKLELNWLPNRVSLAQRVDQLLKQGKQALALELTRLASKKRDTTTVCWNHLIRNALNQDLPKVNFAFKLFNEMKKRAQSPDSYTLSIMLTALSKHPHPKAILPKAINVVNAMQKKDSLVNPNHIHYTQLLQICAKAGDMKSIWHSLSSLPEKGPNAPSSQTYTVVLQAIKTSLQEESLEPQQRQELIQTAIEIWDLVVKKWHEGVVNMDSHLVCAIVRVMTLSDDKIHWLSVFDLIEQTTGQPSLRLPNRDRREALDAKSALVSENSVFSKVPTSVQTSSPIHFIRPTIQLLDAVLWTCFNLKDSVRARHYMEIFSSTGQQQLSPDTASFKVYLKILRRTRSSKQAVEAVQKYAISNRPDWGIFRIAMSTCARNMPNKRTFGEAVELFKLRKSLFPKEPDMKFIEQFVKEVLHHRHVCDLEIRQLMLSEAGEEAVFALSLPNYGWSKEDKILDGTTQSFRQKSCEVANELIRQIDKLTNPNRSDKMKDLVSHGPEEEMSSVSPEAFSKTKQKLSEFIRQVEQEKRTSEEPTPVQ